jgi:uncharacterized membrane protein
VSVPGQQIRASVWMWPAAVTFVSFVVTQLLLTVRPESDQAWVAWLWPADAEAATAMLQTVATAVITASSLTLSITVVAIQLASQQFSPRLLRSFARDPLIQAAMAVFVSAFVVSLTTLRGIDPAKPLPLFSVLLSLVLGLASAAMIIAFIAHMIRRLRIDNMMSSVHHDTVASLRDAYPPYGSGPADPSPDLPGPEGGTVIRAWDSGFVRTIDPEPLIRAAEGLELFLRIDVRPGDSVVRGTPVATAFRLGDDPVRTDVVQRALIPGIALGAERTEEQDVGYGLRQLVDVAVKAISPGINDPTTAAEALGYCADLLVRLQNSRLGPQVQRDGSGRARVLLVDRDIRYYLDLTCGQVRRFGRTEPTVLTAVLRLLRDLAANARDDDQRRAIGEQVTLVLAEITTEMLSPDADAVRDLATRVQQALTGDIDIAFRDRAGETRSI